MDFFLVSQDPCQDRYLRCALRLLLNRFLSFHLRPKLQGTLSHHALLSFIDSKKWTIPRQVTARVAQELGLSVGHQVTRNIGEVATVDVNEGMKEMKEMKGGHLVAGVVEVRANTGELEVTVVTAKVIVDDALAGPTPTIVAVPPPVLHIEYYYSNLHNRCSRSQFLLYSSPL